MQDTAIFKEGNKKMTNQGFPMSSWIKLRLHNSDAAIENFSSEWVHDIKISNSKWRKQFPTNRKQLSLSGAFYDSKRTTRNQKGTHAKITQRLFSAILCVIFLVSGTLKFCQKPTRADLTATNDPMTQ